MAPKARSTRSSSSAAKLAGAGRIPGPQEPTPKPHGKGRQARKRRVMDAPDASETEGDAGEESESESEPDVKVYESDALDEDSAEEEQQGRKRKRAAAPAKKAKRAPRKKAKEAAESDADDDDAFDLKEGQEVVGAVVQAPKTGKVPPGQISQNTFDFLTKLKDPKCNDREWFKLHEPVYRQAEKEWKDFIEAFTDLLTEVDPQVPPLPPKDVVHRIYRDIRFSNDKTPYKRGFSASLSRSGRKGIFAGYHVLIKPGNESLVAAGSWCPGRNELATIRANIQRSSTRLRRVLSAPEFVAHFGEPTPLPGGRRSIFGMEDELKVAPKGVDKGHKDIDLLKCRSFAVVHHFTDEEVLGLDFKSKVATVAKVMQPLVHCLNDMMSVTGGGSDDEEEGEEEGGSDEE